MFLYVNVVVSDIVLHYCFCFCLSAGTGAHNCQYGFEQVAGDIIGHRVVQISATTDTCLALTGMFCTYSHLGFLYTVLLCVLKYCVS